MLPSSVAAGPPLVGMGTSHNCAAQSSGDVYCFGLGSSGQLGNGGVADSSVPAKVTAISTAVDVCAGLDFSCFLLADGAVHCTGANALGQLGNNLASGAVNVPDIVPSLAQGVDKLSCGSQYACAVDNAGVLKCWGTNFRNVLGEASNPDQRNFPSSPSAAQYGASGATVDSVAGGVYHTCLVTSLGAVFCTGYNHAGQVGDGSFTSRWTYRQVVGLISGHTSVSCGKEHTCTLANNGGGIKWWVF
jgi:alpha-tubulin suppressor-like RCC1 family protein